jgi:hypothetical protein
MKKLAGLLRDLADRMDSTKASLAASADVSRDCSPVTIYINAMDAVSFRDYLITHPREISDGVAHALAAGFPIA